MTTHSKPKWLKSIEKLLPIRSQFVLSGNIRDKVWIDNGSRHFYEALWLTLNPLGYECILVWDMVNFFQLYPTQEEVEIGILRNYTGISFDDNGFAEVEMSGLARYIEMMANPPVDHDNQPKKVALVIDYASRLHRDNQTLSEDVRQLFIAAEKASHIARPIKPSGDANAPFLFNPVFWLLNQSNDLPFWLTAGNERIHSIPIPSPSSDVRKVLSEQIFMQFSDEKKDVSSDVFGDLLAKRTNNMSLTSIEDIVTLAINKKIKASEIEEAVLSYRIGDTDLESPWRTNILKDNIGAAEDSNSVKYIQNRVRGQEHAVLKSLDILKRSAIGLTGAQIGKAGARPRGVMFFVGPTGVGKTELAKTIAEIVFGDQESLLRFDMSEFSQEHSGDRLIGAPPGYIGFDQGGELTTAMRENPFRVVLFDEIEKAHSRILDKFLQVLEDGRLTDGRGETAYFSESLIIFTSNLGISRLNTLPNGTYEHEQILSYDRAENMSYKKYEEVLMTGVKDFFTTRLQRPELLNRFGENFLAFKYISQSVAKDILNDMIKNVFNRVQDEHNITLTMKPEVKIEIEKVCTENLDNGGRGIGSKLEDCLVNPLARELFKIDLNSFKEVDIHHIVQKDGDFEIEIHAS